MYLPSLSSFFTALFSIPQLQCYTKIIKYIHFSKIIQFQWCKFFPSEFLHAPHGRFWAILEKWVPYSQRYLFNAIPDTNHNPNPTNPNTRYRCEYGTHISRTAQILYHSGLSSSIGSSIQRMTRGWVSCSIVLGGVCRYATAALLIHAEFTSIHDGILSRSHV